MRANSPTSPTCSRRSACTRSGSTICATPRRPVPVVSTAFRPIDADQLARNPFRVFTSMLATADARFFSPELRGRVERFLAERQAVRPRVDRRGQAHRRSRRCGPRARREVRRRGGGRVRAVPRTDRPRLVRGADRGVRRRRRHRGRHDHAHQPPHAAGTRHRRAVPTDDRAGHHDDRRDSGPTALARSRCAVAADVVSGARRATALPRCRRRRCRRRAAGAVRRGRVARRRPHSRGPPTLRRGHGHPESGQGVGRLLPRHPRAHGVGGPGLLPRWRPVETRCLRGFPARIGGRDIPVKPRYRRAEGRRRGRSRPGLQRRIGWPDRSDITFTIPTSSTRKSHHHDQRSDITASDRRRSSRPSPRRTAGGRLPGRTG